MLVRLFAFTFLFIIGSLECQNLVPNGSFELSLKPVKSRYSGNIESASPWFPAGVGSPDLIKNGEVPYGTQRASEGNQFAGIILYDQSNPEFREYLEVKLARRLMPKEQLKLSMKVSAAEDSKFFTDALGFAITADSIISKNWNVIQREPELRTRKFKALSDTSEQWQAIVMEFEAKGGEQFLTIGNFRVDAATGLQPSGKTSFFKISYLYLDDIRIEPLNKNSEPSLTPVLQDLPGGEELPASKLHVPNVVTPNGDGFNDIFYIQGLPRYSKLKIFSNSGKVLYSTSNYRNDWDGTGFESGNYQYELKLPDGNIITGPIDVVKRK
ncbi:MAG: gliding motility-associated C-terminal domain-containing protein [Bacteroidia bacterium]